MRLTSGKQARGINRAWELLRQESIRKDEQGAVMIIFAVGLLFLIIGVLALSIDRGKSMMDQSEIEMRLTNSTKFAGNEYVKWRVRSYVNSCTTAPVKDETNPDGTPSLLPTAARDRQLCNTTAPISSTLPQNIAQRLQQYVAQQIGDVPGACVSMPNINRNNSGDEILDFYAKVPTAVYFGGTSRMGGETARTSCNCSNPATPGEEENGCITVLSGIEVPFSPPPPGQGEALAQIVLSLDYNSRERIGTTNITRFGEALEATLRGLNVANPNDLSIGTQVGNVPAAANVRINTGTNCIGPDGKFLGGANCKRVADDALGCDELGNGTSKGGLVNSMGWSGCAYDNVGNLDGTKIGLADQSRRMCEQSRKWPFYAAFHAGYTRKCAGPAVWTYKQAVAEQCHEWRGAECRDDCECPGDSDSIKPGSQDDFEYCAREGERRPDGSRGPCREEKKGCRWIEKAMKPVVIGQWYASCPYTSVNQAIYQEPKSYVSFTGSLTAASRVVGTPRVGTGEEVGADQGIEIEGEIVGGGGSGLQVDELRQMVARNTSESWVWACDKEAQERMGYGNRQHGAPYGGPSSLSLPRLIEANTPSSPTPDAATNACIIPNPPGPGFESYKVIFRRKGCTTDPKDRRDCISVSGQNILDGVDADGRRITSYLSCDGRTTFSAANIRTNEDKAKKFYVRNPYKGTQQTHKNCDIPEGEYTIRIHIQGLQGPLAPAGAPAPEGGNAPRFPATEASGGNGGGFGWAPVDASLYNAKEGDMGSEYGGTRECPKVGNEYNDNKEKKHENLASYIREGKVVVPVVPGEVLSVTSVAVEKARDGTSPLIAKHDGFDVNFTSLAPDCASQNPKPPFVNASLAINGLYQPLITGAAEYPWFYRTDFPEAYWFNMGVRGVLAATSVHNGLSWGVGNVGSGGGNALENRPGCPGGGAPVYMPNLNCIKYNGSTDTVLNIEMQKGNLSNVVNFLKQGYSKYNIHEGHGGNQCPLVKAAATRIIAAGDDVDSDAPRSIVYIGSCPSTSGTNWYPAGDRSMIFQESYNDINCNVPCQGSPQVCAERQLQCEKNRAQNNANFFEYGTKVNWGAFSNASPAVTGQPGEIGLKAVLRPIPGDPTRREVITASLLKVMNSPNGIEGTTSIDLRKETLDCFKEVKDTLKPDMFMVITDSSCPELAKLSTSAGSGGSSNRTSCVVGPDTAPDQIGNCVADYVFQTFVRERIREVRKR